MADLFMRLLSEENPNRLRFGLMTLSLSIDMAAPDGAKDRTDGAD